jgi:transcriptional regulator with GAF, ATPase, and Fis domain
MQIKDISQAFLYHLQWKSRLRDFVDGKGDFDVTEISSEGCDLGKWLSSDEIRQYASNSNIEELLSAHNELHETAKRVYDLKVMGQNNAARQELSNIVKSSMKIYALLNALHIVTESESVVLGNAF